VCVWLCVWLCARARACNHSVTARGAAVSVWRRSWTACGIPAWTYVRRRPTAWMPSSLRTFRWSNRCLGLSRRCLRWVGIPPRLSCKQQPWLTLPLAGAELGGPRRAACCAVRLGYAREGASPHCQLGQVKGHRRRWSPSTQGVTPLPCGYCGACRRASGPCCFPEHAETWTF